MAAVAQSRPPTVWSQDFAVILRGTKKISSEEFQRALDKILKARQEGIFPLTGEALNSCSKGKDLQTAAIAAFESFTGQEGLEKRMGLLTAKFFVVVANTDGCTLTAAQQNAAQQKYLPQMLEAIKAKELLENEQIRTWLESFYVASYSKVINALDNLYKGLPDGLRETVEGESKAAHMKMFQDFAAGKYKVEDINSLSATIAVEMLHQAPTDGYLRCDTEYMLDVYEQYKEVVKTHFQSAGKESEFWEAKIISLNAFAAQLTS